MSFAAIFARATSAVSVLLLVGAAGCPPPADDGDNDGPDAGNGDEGEGEGEGEQERSDAGPQPEPDVSGLDARPTNSTCVAVDRPVDNSEIALTQVFENLDLNSPLFLLERPGDDTRFYAIERGGRVVRWAKNDDTVTTPEVFCDLRDRVETSDSGNSEQGLLGIAFHPDDPAELYLSYTAVNDNSPCTFQDASNCVFESRLSRFTIDADGCDTGSEVVLLDIDDFASNHNGGHILFGPDGTLFFGMGDGGFADDPARSGQDLELLLGKMIRIDVDRDEDGLGYAIPADNPFKDVVGARPEIYAYGLRNPWRFSFDRASGELWVGDVGQNRIEEIDIVEAGGNYGWSAFEGTDCFRTDDECNVGGFVPPVVEYLHSNQLARFSVTGGYVYRGAALPDLVGTYLFGDFASKEVFRLTVDAQGVAGFEPIATMSGQGIASFSEDSAGELYLVDLAGQLFRVDPAGPPVVDTFPKQLSQTGCMDPQDTTKLAPGVIPYQLNHAFYSDGASKQRGVGLPEGGQATIGADGDIDLPDGTVFVKSFEVDGALVETRLLMRHDDSNWAGYTYEWNAGAADAQLVDAGGKSKVLGNGQTWTYPSRAGCLVCHTAAAGRVLGWEVGQLNGGFNYPQTGRLANQLFTLKSIGVFTNPPADVADEAVYPAIDLASVSVEARARTYLHVNCAMCHRPGGGGQSDADMRLTASGADANLCGEAPEQGSLGVDGAQVIFPGDPAKSLVSLRMKRLGAGRMPPVGTNVVDVLGTDVVDRYITGLTSCPE